MNSKICNIYAITHKDIQVRLKPPIELFYVGTSNENNYVLNELSGDTIVSKNKSFCELTGHYWIWKNILPTLSPDNIIGFCHYRRFFTFGESVSVTKLGDFDPSILIHKILDDGHSSILPAPLTFSQHNWIKNSFKYRRLFTPYTKLNLLEQYAENHSVTDLVVAANMLPDAHREKFKKYLESCCLLSPYNMYIAHSKSISDYFNLLFPWLFEVEKQIDVTLRDPYQTRVFGFLAERFASYYFQSYTNPYYSDVTLYDF